MSEIVTRLAAHVDLQLAPRFPVPQALVWIVADKFRRRWARQDTAT